MEKDMEKNEYPKGFIDFNKQLEERMRATGCDDIIIHYTRPNELSELELWLKTNLDKMEIKKIEYALRGGKFSFSGIELFCLRSGL